MQERNKQMDVLLCLGMLLVILGHVGTNSWKTELFDWFVIYSFHMPLFFFISGYFYKPAREQAYGRTILRLIRKFVLPYYIWNLVYAIVVFLLKNAGYVRFQLNPSLSNFFLTPWTTGDQYQLNSPAWFLLTLFLVEVVYLSLHKFFAFIKIRNDTLLLLPFVCMGIAGGGMMVHGIAKGGMLVLAKLLYAIFFYHLGHLYYEKLEKFDRLGNLPYFGILFVIQYFLMVKTNGFPYISMWNGSITTMGKNIFLPVAVALTGIAFMLRISKILTLSLGESKIIKKISTSTKTIMIHHYAVIVLFNVALSFLYRHGVELKNFDPNWVSVLYKYPGPHNHMELFSMVYIVLCFTVPIGMSTFFQKIVGIASGKLRRTK
ncbi:MAG: acyltransferase family protein [Lachnospiraceae bacterium]|nr:acyltransferase family protein [Lachnospiraceae bacterium]